MSHPDTIELNPCQSLALRRAIDAMRANDSIYSACPDVVRSALCDLLLPPFSSAELEIAALKADMAATLQTLEKFGNRIRDLETLLRRRPIPPPPC